MTEIENSIPDAELERALQFSRQQRTRRCIEELNQLLADNRCEAVPYLILPGGEKISLVAVLKMLRIEASISIEVVAK